MEVFMLEMSKDAKKELDAYFEGKEKGAIRIYLAPGGCSGPMLNLALDEPTADDNTEELEGYTFCIAKPLAEQTGNIKIDLGPMGFALEPEKPLPKPAGGSACGGCCGGCGH